MRANCFFHQLAICQILGHGPTATAT